MDYKFGNKNNWRRTMWNRITERLAVPVSQAIVIYLAGSKDLDRAEALRRGYRQHNLIAVERDRDALEILRGSGVLCIESDFVDAVNAWPPEREAHVIFGDFCSGLELRFVHALRLWMNERASFHRAVFAFNMLRGRDPSGAVARRQVDQGRTAESWAHPLAKHRGVYLIRIAWEQFQFCQKLRGDDGKVVSAKASMEVAEWFLKAIASRYEYYKSGPQVFDSVVWRNPYQFMASNPARDEKEEAIRAKKAAAATARRKVSAVLAHRTMRMQ